MNFKIFTRLFSIIILSTLCILQGCYEQTTPGAEETITDPAKKPSAPPINMGNQAKDSVEISLHPMPQTIHSAQSFTLNVSASGNKRLRYQWRKNGKIIRNAVRPDYTVAKASISDQGRYDVIVMSGKRIVVSRAASITFGTDRSANLSWAAPAKRADGSPLSEDEIAAYRIYHSSDDARIGREYEVDPGQQHFELDDLPRGAHHFAIATVDINGMESTLSSIVTKRIL